jgi:hypothetical protein
MQEKFTFIDLFAGIGGMRIAFEKSGGRCVFSSEWNKFSQQTYEANFGDVPDGDITKIKARDIPNHDILVGGFPCFLPSAFFELTPAIENGWHGKPPTSMSWFGISLALILVMSPSGTSPKFASYVCWENLFHSDEKTHLPPDFSKAILIPPIPAKRSMNVNFSCMLFYEVLDY